VILRFLEHVSGYSRQQISRLVKRSGERRQFIKRYRGSRTSFARTYTSADVLLLAHTDSLHGTLSGLATKKLMERAYVIFDDVSYIAVPPAPTLAGSTVRADAGGWRAENPALARWCVGAGHHGTCWAVCLTLKICTMRAAACTR
jgi:hypothetical protein